MKFAGVFLLLALAQAGCAPSPPRLDRAAIEAATHGAYVEAINSNEVERIMSDLTADVVYQSPNEPELAGKDAVRKWATAYAEAYAFKWEKASLGFTVTGDWAFERYRYKATNIDKKTGASAIDVGKGVNVFHHDPDGKWRVAIDSWNSDLPAGK
jgi:ketosteroid isomerase-like protein